MKEVLKQQGWSCHLCSCTGIKGDDCSHREFRGYVIKTRGTSFRIFNKGIVIESAQGYLLTDKLKKHELYKESI